MENQDFVCNVKFSNHELLSTDNRQPSTTPKTTLSTYYQS